MKETAIRSIQQTSDSKSMTIAKAWTDLAAEPGSNLTLSSEPTSAALSLVLSNGAPQSQLQMSFTRTMH